MCDLIKLWAVMRMIDSCGNSEFAVAPVIQKTFDPCHINSQQNALQRPLCISFIKFSSTCFGRYCDHLQGDTVTAIQRYKCDQLCRCHSITIKNYYNFS